MANLFNWVEIPTVDMERARSFYRTILGLQEEIPQRDLGGGMLYAFLPGESDGVGGALVNHPRCVPAKGDGVCVYLIVQGDLNNTLARVESAGGSVVVPKMSLGEMSPGYCAQFIDSEGNRVGLWSAE